VTRLARVGVGAMAVAGLCLWRASPPGDPVMAPNLAVASGPAQLLIAQPSEAATVITLHDCSARGISSKTRLRVGERLLGLAPGADGTALAWSRRDAYLIEPLAARVTPIWRSPHDILQLLVVKPPASDGSRVLALTAEDTSGERPLASHLYLLDPAGSEPPRLLALGSGYNFWAASTGDVDGDGAQDLALCTWSYTARDPAYAQRFFVYGWDEGDELFPRWRGSRLCRRYLRAGLSDLGEGPDGLVSVEVAPHGGELLVAYEWNQFGFWGLGHSRPFARVQQPQLMDLGDDGAPALVAVVRDDCGACRALAFECKDDRLALVARSAPLDETIEITVLPRDEGNALVAWNRQGDPRPRYVAFERVTDEEENNDA